MARITEPSEPANTLPRPELNPLLNPLLADHMGRWAEVYFTTPPEKREEAVLDLLHELEREQHQAQNAVRPAATSDKEELTRAENRRSGQTQEEFQPCPSCGHENPVAHQFCGMCGQRIELGDRNQQQDQMSPASFPEHELAEEIRDDASPSDDQIPAAQYEVDRDECGIDSETDSQLQPMREATERRAIDEFHPPASPYNDLSLFQSLRPKEEEEWGYESSRSSPYRFYIAAVLAIVILGLGYMAWRGSQESQTSHEAPPPPPPASESNSSLPESAVPADTSKGQSSVPANTALAKTGEDTTPQTASPKPSRSHTENQPNEDAKNAAPSAVAPKIRQTDQTSSTNGVEELAMAEHFLDGTGGHARDAGEAVKWLWKSIEKQNGRATLILADLYLKGDGVPKNCDQGRVLLDSAASKGIPGAGERLRNLQAFGCP